MLNYSLIRKSTCQVRESCQSHVYDWESRPHSVSITEFGAVGDGKTLNTHAFENAMFSLRSYADKGGVQLYIPKGTWLTGSISLISHLTLFLERGATILGSEDHNDFPIIPALPSYGRGRELPGPRYSSLINGENLTDVVITGAFSISNFQPLFLSHSLEFALMIGC